MQRLQADDALRKPNRSTPRPFRTSGAPEGWDHQAPFHFVDGIDAAVAKARELAGERTVEFAAGDVGGQATWDLIRAQVRGH
jgi:hypothetical protein